LLRAKPSQKVVLREKVKLALDQKVKHLKQKRVIFIPNWASRISYKGFVLIC